MRSDDHDIHEHNADPHAHEHDADRHAHPHCPQHDHGHSPCGHPHEGHQHGRGSGRGHGHGSHHDRSGSEHEPGDHPTLVRSIAKSARRIRRSGLTPEQLQHRIAATVTHGDHVTTMRTLQRIGNDLRPER